MNITVIYHLYRNTENLKESLNSLLNQTNKNFELIFVNDGGKSRVLEIVEKYDFSTIEKVKTITISENLGHSYSFNSGLANASGKYIYYSGSNTIMEKNFIDVIENNIDDSPEVVYFDSKVKKGSKKSPKEVLSERFSKNLKNKVFSKEFLYKNNICLTNYKYFPLVFLIDVLSISKKWNAVDKNICTFCPKENYSYNLYNSFEQGDILIQRYSDSNLWKNNKNIFEYLIIFSIIYTFITKIFKLNNNKKTRLLALLSAKRWLEENIPNWRKNEILKNNLNKDDELIVGFIRDFEFEIKYVQSFLRLGKKND